MGELEEEDSPQGNGRMETLRIAETLGIIPGGGDQSYSPKGQLGPHSSSCVPYKYAQGLESERYSVAALYERR